MLLCWNFPSSGIKSGARRRDRDRQKEGRDKEEKKRNGGKESNRSANQLETMKENVGRTQVARFRHVRPTEISKGAFGFAEDTS